MKYHIETQRLILRDILVTDDEAIFALDSDPEVQRYVGNKPLKAIDEARAVIEHIRRQYNTNGIGRWAVIEKASSNFVGWAGLKLMQEPVNGYVDFYDVGYRFIKNYWGRGYATEAASATLQYAWEIMKLEKVNAFADAYNIASRNVLSKVGLHFKCLFDYEGNAHAWYEMNNPLK